MIASPYAAATVSGEGDKPWIETDGVQDNDWAWQIISSCDLTPGTTSPGEVTDGAGNYVYRFDGDRIAEMWMFLGALQDVGEAFFA